MNYRRRFVTLDIALSLVDIAQQSKSETLCATAAMAIAQCFSLTLSAHHFDDSDAFSMGAAAAPSPSKDRLRTASSSLSGKYAVSQANTSFATDPFQAPIMVSSAQFVAKVMERVNLPQMLETLQEGTPRLQQALLTWISLILICPLTQSDSMDILQAIALHRKGGFSTATAISTPQATTPKSGSKQSLHNQSQMTSNTTPTATNESDLTSLLQSLQKYPQQPHMCGKIDASHVVIVYNILSNVRSYLLKAHAVLVPTLFRLIEQGGLIAIRGKALLVLQLLCVHHPALVLPSLSERRLSSILQRVLEPMLSTLPTNNNGQAPADTVEQNATQSLTSLNYVMKIALSMLLFVRNFSEKLASDVTDYVTELANISSEQVHTFLALSHYCFSVVSVVMLMHTCILPNYRSHRCCISMIRCLQQLL
jgi:hypothetical protein